MKTRIKIEEKYKGGVLVDTLYIPQEWTWFTLLNNWCMNGWSDVPSWICNNYDIMTSDIDKCKQFLDWYNKSYGVEIEYKCRYEDYPK